MDLNLRIETGLVTPEEIAQLTKQLAARSARWLTENDWGNAAGIPVVGRLYVRFKLGDIALKDLVPAQGVVHWDRIKK